MTWMWFWVLAALWFALRMNYWKRQAAMARASAEKMRAAINDGAPIIAAELARRGEPNRETRVNDKLRDRCLSLEKTTNDLNNEVRKRDMIIAELEGKIRQASRTPEPKRSRA